MTDESTGVGGIENESVWVEWLKYKCSKTIGAKRVTLKVH